MLLAPDMRFAALKDVDFRRFSDMGISTLLLDIDNTLTGWNEAELDEAHRSLLEQLKSQFDIVLCSNRKEGKGRLLAESLGLECIAPAYKPMPFRIKAYLGSKGVPPSKAAVLGDQLVTDILAGRLSGCTTVLVEPMSGREFIGTKINRFIEGLLGRRPY